MLRKLKKQEKPVRDCVSRLQAYIKRFAIVDYYSGWSMDGSKPTVNKPNKSVTLLATSYNCSASKAQIKKVLACTSSFPQGHVCANAETPKGSNLKPRVVHLTQRAVRINAQSYYWRIFGHDPTRYSCNPRIFKRCQKKLQPILHGKSVIINECNYSGSAL
jgi:hypothetical protein